MDAIRNNGGGASYRATIADGLDISDHESIETTLEDRIVDAFELSVTMGFGETGKIAFVHKSFDIGMSE